MSKFKHIIFDIDGTIVDTDAAVYETIKCTLKSEFPEYSLDGVDLSKTLGIALKDAFVYLNLPFTDAFDAKFTANCSKYAHLMHLYEGVEELLKELKENDFVLGIVSSRPRIEYDLYIKPLGIDEYFSYKVLRDDTVNHKPSADPLEKYIKDMRAKKEECIYIGDMDTDILCAKNAGIQSGKMMWDVSKSKTEQANYNFRSINEIRELLLKKQL